jgi:hypothetical protein
MVKILIKKYLVANGIIIIYQLKIFNRYITLWAQEDLR